MQLIPTDINSNPNDKIYNEILLNEVQKIFDEKY